MMLIAYIAIAHEYTYEHMYVRVSQIIAYYKLCSFTNGIETLPRSHPHTHTHELTTPLIASIIFPSLLRLNCRQTRRESLKFLTS